MKPRRCKILRAAAAAARGAGVRPPTEITRRHFFSTAPSCMSSATVERPAPIARQRACGAQRRKSQCHPHVPKPLRNQLLDQPACPPACHTAPRGAARRNDHTRTRTATCAAVGIRSRRTCLLLLCVRPVASAPDGRLCCCSLPAASASLAWPPAAAHVRAAHARADRAVRAAHVRAAHVRAAQAVAAAAAVNDSARQTPRSTSSLTSQ